MSLKRWKTSDRSLVLSGGDEADGPSCRAAIIVAEKECCSIHRDCQDRCTRTRVSGLSRRSSSEGGWCGGREGQPSGGPDWAP